MVHQMLSSLTLGLNTMSILSSSQEEEDPSLWTQEVPAVSWPRPSPSTDLAPAWLVTSATTS